MVCKSVHELEKLECLFCIASTGTVHILLSETPVCIPPYHVAQSMRTKCHTADTVHIDRRLLRVCCTVLLCGNCALTDARTDARAIQRERCVRCLLCGIWRLDRTDRLNVQFHLSCLQAIFPHALHAGCKACGSCLLEHEAPRC